MTTETAARDAVVLAARHLSSMGLAPGSTGDVSVRLEDRLLVTPAGSSLSRVLPADLAVVALDGAVISGQPSTETNLHRAVYGKRPGARAVVHLHSPYAVAAACLDVRTSKPSLPFLTPHQVLRVGDLPMAPYGRPGSGALALGVGALVAEHAAMLMRNHGSLVAAATLDAAVDLAEEVEAAARVALLVRGLPARPLTTEQVAGLLG